jgi:hypothetical protein
MCVTCVICMCAVCVHEQQLEMRGVHLYSGFVVFVLKGVSVVYLYLMNILYY